MQDMKYATKDFSSKIGETAEVRPISKIVAAIRSVSKDTVRLACTLNNDLSSRSVVPCPEICGQPMAEQPPRPVSMKEALEEAEKDIHQIADELHAAIRKLFN